MADIVEYRTENNKANKISIEMNCFEIVTIIGHIELAIRHPLNKGPASTIAKNVAIRLIDEVIENWPIILENSALTEAWENVFEIKIKKEGGPENA
ncbi:MAG: hypothetical protein FVQ85_21620 [Planctomycetes bacterium]|nr:hypothetical protein [Planctomycetota bacterium]